MSQIIGTFRKCEYCNFWYGILEGSCPNCGALNEPIEVSILLQQRAVTWPESKEFSGRTPDLHRFSESACDACVRVDPYTAKDCFHCQESDMEDWEFDPLIQKAEAPSLSPGKSRRSRFRFAIPASIFSFLLGGLLVATPLIENASATFQENVAAEKRSEEETEKRLWARFIELQTAEGWDAAVAWAARAAGEEETKKAAEKILGWCKWNKPDELVWRKPFENDDVWIDIDGAESLSGESYRTYMKTGHSILHPGSVFSVEYMIDGKYATLEGKLFIAESAARVPEDSEVWKKIKVTVQGDHGRVLAAYDNFHKRDRAVSVRVPVTGESSLKIVFENCDTNGGILGRELLPLVVLGDPVLTHAYDTAA